MAEYALVKIDGELDATERNTIAQRLSLDIENSSEVSVGGSETIESLLYE